MTGSSSRKLKRTRIDLLAGRVLNLSLHPFMAAELGKKCSFNKAFRFGLLPLVVAPSDPEKVLKTYAALYVREEVQMEGLVRNISGFSRFLEAVSFSHGAVLNISDVARECEVERKVVEGYVNILEDLLLSFRLPVFTIRAKRATAAHPKFYYCDTGVFPSLRPTGPLDRPEAIEGAALEGLVAQHLVAWNAYRGEKNKIYYWRTRSKVEVDFIVYGEETFGAIEVKNTSRIRKGDLNSLHACKGEYPQCSAFLLYRGKERIMREGVSCIPCNEFLIQLDPTSKLIE